MGPFVPWWSFVQHAPCQVRQESVVALVMQWFSTSEAVVNRSEPPLQPNPLPSVLPSAEVTLGYTHWFYPQKRFLQLWGKYVDRSR
jgi:hypothetical protein